jgi:tetratricopeptide (TPR) repeat protein
MLEESLPVHRREGDGQMVAKTVGLLATAALAIGETDSALALSREALDVAREGVSPYIQSAALWQLGVCLAVRGELDDAERMLEEAVDLARKLGNVRSVGAWQKSLAGVVIMRGDRARAWRLFDESLTIHRSLNDAWGVSHALASLAFLALEAGDVETAHKLLFEALAIERERDHPPRLANVLEMSARLAAGEGQPALAIRLFARAALLREIVGAMLHYELGWPDPTLQIGDLRRVVGEATFEEEWERGRAMSLREAIDEASGIERELEPAHASHPGELGEGSSS